jgi:hypothetical protein
MADITVTAANVAPGTGAVVVTGTFGETVTAGQAVYLKSSDSEWYLANADAATTDDVVGIALNGGANGQPGSVQTRGQITIGGTVAIGTVYVLSAAAAGGIAPVADLAATNLVTVVGVGITAAIIDMHIKTTSVAVPA